MGGGTTAEVRSRERQQAAGRRESRERTKQCRMLLLSDGVTSGTPDKPVINDSYVTLTGLHFFRSLTF